MRVLVLTTSVTSKVQAGGVQSVAIFQSSALATLGLDVELHFLTDLISYKNSSFKSRGYRSWTSTRNPKFLFSPWALVDTLRKFRKFDVFHIHMAVDFFTLPITAVLLFLKKKVVIQTHGMITEKSFKTPLIGLILKYVLSKPRIHLVLTDKEFNDISNFSKAGTICKFINPIKLKYEWQGTASNELLFVSRYHSRKQPLLLARAFKNYLENTMGSKLTLNYYGQDQGEKSKLIDFVVNNRIESKIIVNDSLTNADVVERLKNAAALILPSLNEPYPMIVLESIGVGCPVILTEQIEFAHDLADRHGAILFQPTESGIEVALERFSRMSADERLEMSHNAFRWAQEKFSEDMYVEHIKEFYDRIEG